MLVKHTGHIVPPAYFFYREKEKRRKKTPTPIASSRYRLEQKRAHGKESMELFGRVLDRGDPICVAEGGKKKKRDDGMEKEGTDWVDVLGEHLPL